MQRCVLKKLKTSPRNTLCISLVKNYLLSKTCICYINFVSTLRPDRLLRDWMNANVMNPPGSMPSTCAKWQLKQHTAQVGEICSHIQVLRLEIVLKSGVFMT